METFFIITDVAVFLIIAAVTYHVFSEQMNYDTVPSVSIAIAVSLLSVLGLKQCIKPDDIGGILLPYAFFGIIVVLGMLTALITNLALKKHKEHLCRRNCQECKEEFTEQKNKSSSLKDSL